MFWFNNKIPLRFQIIYTIVFVIYFALSGGLKFKIEVWFFVIIIGTMISSVQYSYLYFAEKAIIKTGITNQRVIYLLAFLVLYILNFCFLLLFTPVQFNHGKSYVFVYGFYGVSSIGFMALLLTPFYKFLLKK